MSGPPERHTALSSGYPDQKKWLAGPVATIFKATVTGAWRVERPVILPERCTACGLCQKYCPPDVITIEEKHVNIDYNYCKGCGICANLCPRQSIQMQPEEG